MILVEQTGTFASNENSIFSLKPDFSIPLQPATQAHELGHMAPSLADFIKGQAADVLCYTAAKKLENAKTKMTINKKEFLCDAYALIKPYKSSLRSHCDNGSLPRLTSIRCTAILDNNTCMTPCDGNVPVLKCP